MLDTRLHRPLLDLLVDLSRDKCTMAAQKLHLRLVPGQVVKPKSVATLRPKDPLRMTLKRA